MEKDSIVSFSCCQIFLNYFIIVNIPPATYFQQLCAVIGISDGTYRLCIDLAIRPAQKYGLLAKRRGK